MIVKSFIDEFLVDQIEEKLLFLRLFQELMAVTYDLRGLGSEIEA
jgi:hypothetical protein